MKKQTDFLVGRGGNAAPLDSSLSLAESHQGYKDLREDRLKRLDVAPEGLLQTRADQKISLLAIDEAHRISRWGHYFRPEYEGHPARRALNGSRGVGLVRSNSVAGPGCSNTSVPFGSSSAD